MTTFTAGPPGRSASRARCGCGRPRSARPRASPRSERVVKKRRCPPIGSKCWSKRSAAIATRRSSGCAGVVSSSRPPGRSTRRASNSSAERVGDVLDHLAAPDEVDARVRARRVDLAARRVGVRGRRRCRPARARGSARCRSPEVEPRVAVRAARSSSSRRAPLPPPRLVRHRRPHQLAGEPRHRRGSSRARARERCQPWSVHHSCTRRGTAGGRGTSRRRAPRARSGGRTRAASPASGRGRRPAPGRARTRAPCAQRPQRPLAVLGAGQVLAERPLAPQRRAERARAVRVAPARVRARERGVLADGLASGCAVPVVRRAEGAGHASSRRSAATMRSSQPSSRGNACADSATTTSPEHAAAPRFSARPKVKRAPGSRARVRRRASDVADPSREPESTTTTSCAGDERRACAAAPRPRRAPG